MVGSYRSHEQTYWKVTNCASKYFKYAGRYTRLSCIINLSMYDVIFRGVYSRINSLSSWLKKKKTVIDFNSIFIEVVRG